MEGKKREGENKVPAVIMGTAIETGHPMALRTHPITPPKQDRQVRHYRKQRSTESVSLLELARQTTANKAILDHILEQSRSGFSTLIRFVRAGYRRTMNANAFVYSIRGSAYNALADVLTLLDSVYL